MLKKMFLGLTGAALLFTATSAVADADMPGKGVVV
jgi:hypothetical protein